MLQDVSGVYGCIGCNLGGSRLILRQDSTYSLCTFSDTPEYDESFVREDEGRYSLNGSLVVLGSARDMNPVRMVFVSIGNDLYLVDEDTYLKYGDDQHVIQDIGQIRRDPADFPRSSPCTI